MPILQMGKPGDREKGINCPVVEMGLESGPSDFKEELEKQQDVKR